MTSSPQAPAATLKVPRHPAPAAVALLLLVALILLAPKAGAADAFYERLHEDGLAALATGNPGRAAELLRIACFGMLDEPPELAACLTWLAIAQQQAGDSETLQSTVARLDEIQRRFGALEQAAIDPDTRDRLESALRRGVPEARLAVLPTFAHLAPRPEDHLAALPPRQRRAAPAKLAKAEAEPAEADAPARQAPLDPVMPVEYPAGAGNPLAPAAALPDVPTPDPAENGPAEEAETDPNRASATPESPTLGTDDIRRLLDDGRTFAAWTLADELARATPDNPELQLLAAETAYCVARWKDAHTYYERAGGAPADRPEMQLQHAVALYEDGLVDQAADLLRRCLPHLRRTAFVDDCVRRILGDRPDE